MSKPTSEAARVLRALLETKKTTWNAGATYHCTPVPFAAPDVAAALAAVEAEDAAQEPTGGAVPRICCGDYENCQRPCTPRGRWLCAQEHEGWQARAAWTPGIPPKHYAKEWFIAETTFGDRVVLRALPEEYAYDFTTADETYMKANRIVRWMPFPDSEYLSPNEVVAQQQEPPVATHRAVEAWVTRDEGENEGEVHRTTPTFSDDGAWLCGDMGVLETRDADALLGNKRGADAIIRVFLVPADESSAEVLR